MRPLSSPASHRCAPPRQRLRSLGQQPPSAHAEGPRPSRHPAGCRFPGHRPGPLCGRAGPGARKKRPALRVSLQVIAQSRRTQATLRQSPRAQATGLSQVRSAAAAAPPLGQQPPSAHAEGPRPSRRPAGAVSPATGRVHCVRAPAPAQEKERPAPRVSFQVIACSAQPDSGHLTAERQTGHTEREERLTIVTTCSIR